MAYAANTKEEEADSFASRSRGHFIRRRVYSIKDGFKKTKQRYCTVIDFYGLKPLVLNVLDVASFTSCFRTLCSDGSVIPFASADLHFAQFYAVSSSTSVNNGMEERFFQIFLKELQEVSQFWLTYMQI